jgi:hypothetical protein
LEPKITSFGSLSFGKSDVRKGKPFSIYDASAGSGKTYALVKEYLKIILVAKK